MVAAVKMAVRDSGGAVLGQPIEIVQAETSNKPDSAAQTARRWFEVEGVDVIVGLPVTPVALAVQNVARSQKKILLINEGASTELTGKQCSPYTVHFADDTNALAAGTARALVQEGNKDWFFLTADFAFGHTMEEAASKVVTELGGHVVGRALHPLNATDYASPLLQAQQSSANVIALANSAEDTIDTIKQAAESEWGETVARSLRAFCCHQRRAFARDCRWHKASSSPPDFIGTRIKTRAPSPSASRPSSKDAFRPRRKPMPMRR